MNKNVRYPFMVLVLITIIAVFAACTLGPSERFVNSVDENHERMVAPLENVIPTFTIEQLEIFQGHPKGYYNGASKADIDMLKQQLIDEIKSIKLNIDANKQLMKGGEKDE